MPVIVEDHFAAVADTALAGRSPDTIGNAWVSVDVDGTNFLEVVGATDRLWTDTNNNNSGECCKSAPDPSVVTYDVKTTLAAVDTGTGTATKEYLVARLVDANNFYAMRVNATGIAGNDTELIKRVTGTVTVLTSVDTGLVNGDAMVLHMTDAAKSIDKNGSQILTSGDNVLTAAGSAGVAMGGWGGINGRQGGTYRFDDYFVEEIIVSTRIPRHPAILNDLAIY